MYSSQQYQRSTNRWDKNILAVFIAQTLTNVTRQFYRNKKFSVDRKAHFVSSSYVWCGATQSMHRTTLGLWHNIHFFFIFSLRYIEHTVVFFSFSLASGLSRVFLRVQHLIVCQLRSCHNKCFLRESNTFFSIVKFSWLEPFRFHVNCFVVGTISLSCKLFCGWNHFAFM